MIENKSDGPQSGPKKGLLKKILAIATPWRAPDTKEELESEIHELLEDGEEHGLISALEEEMIKSIFNFRDTKVLEIMTPAASVFSHDLAMPIEDLIKGVIEKGFTRIPIYQTRSDNVVGILHAKDLLKICLNKSEQDLLLSNYLLPVYFISESKPIVDVLKEFQQQKNHMAMVTDEFGAVRGLITMEDILEEIVGDIDDEYDVDEGGIEEIDSGSIQVKGWVDIEDVEGMLGVSLPAGPYESVGGFLIHILGRLGKTGDQVDVDSLHFEIKAATSRRIKLILIKKNNGTEVQA